MANSAVGAPLKWRLCRLICGKSRRSTYVSTGTPAKGTMTARKVGLASSHSRFTKPWTRMSQSAGWGDPGPSVTSTEAGSKARSLSAVSGI